MKKLMKKKYDFGPILIALFFMAILSMVVSGKKVCEILMEYWQGEKTYTELANRFAVPDRESPRIIIPSVPAGEEGERAPISISFNELLAECGDAVGWLYCADTPIHYPIVQSSDNEYYLHRLPDGRDNSSGTIFLDYRNRPDFSDWNSIVYGHNMKNDTMFGTLHEYKRQEYYEAHPIWYLLTPEKDYIVELIGGYTTSGTSHDTYAIPEDAEGRDELVKTARQNSAFRSETQVGEGDRLITLSTCTYEYDDARYVLVGILKEL